MSGELAVAVIAEHVCTGSPLADIVGRLGANDRAALASEAATVQHAVNALRDLAAPRRTESPTPRVTDRSAPPMPNRYGGKCQCSRWVPEGHGRAVKAGAKWTLFCKPCAKENGYA